MTGSSDIRRDAPADPRPLVAHLQRPQDGALGIDAHFHAGYNLPVDRCHGVLGEDPVAVCPREEFPDGLLPRALRMPSRPRFPSAPG